MEAKVPPSLWLSRPGTPEEVDVAVVGGGIVGLSTAYWLLQAGRRPVVLEADAVAAHSSGRNAGFLLTGSAEPFTVLARAVGEAKARELWELSRLNREMLRGELLDTGRVECEFLAEGSWMAALADGGQEREEELRASGELLRRFGFEIEWRSAAEVRRAAGSPLLGGALYQPRDGGLDPVRLCRGLAELVAAGGCAVRGGVQVVEIEPAGGRVRLATSAGVFVAERAVLAVNAYAPELLPHLAAEVRPVRGQALATEPGERDLPGVWYVDSGNEYLRQLPDGTLLVGGCRSAARELEVGYGEHPTAAVQSAIDRFARQALPRFAERAVRWRWAGIMAFTPDGLPRTGNVPGIPGAVYAAGFNGHGMSLGFAMGRALAEGGTLPFA